MCEDVGRYILIHIKNLRLLAQKEKFKKKKKGNIKNKILLSILKSKNNCFKINILFYLFI